MAFYDLLKDVFGDTDRYETCDEEEFYNNILPKLPDEQSMVIRLRFGLLPENVFYTRKKISEILEKRGSRTNTVSRVRDIQQLALREFRNPFSNTSMHKQCPLK